MNTSLLNRIIRCNDDYKKLTGETAQNFYCPILHVDQKVELQKGHIVNEAFVDSDRTWVVQRKDVDNFYGAYFESSFTAIQHYEKIDKHNIFCDLQLYKHFNPKIYLDGKQVNYFPFRKYPIPKGHTLVTVHSGSDETKLCINCENTDDFLDSGRWKVIVSKDTRVSATVSLIKAAHLSMFSMFGYEYVLSDAGRYIGHDFLGRFYEENKSETSKQTIRRNAVKVFAELKNIVRPLAVGSDVMLGTVKDGEMSFCASNHGLPWGVIIFIRTGKLQHAVLLPAFYSSEGVETYRGFLQNDNTEIRVMKGKFDFNNKTCRVNPDRIKTMWPKSLETWPTTVE